MAKRTQRDNIQIQQFEHDEISNAKRVKIADTEIGIELDHSDGDSVTIHPSKLVVSSLGVDASDSEIIPAQDCSSLKTLKIYIVLKSGLRNSNILTQISPVDSGDVWFTLDTNVNSNESSIMSICARRVRVLQTNPQGSFELDVHLVGQG